MAVDFDLYKQFIMPSCDRIKFIQDFLAKENIECPIMMLDGKKHLYVKFPLSQYNPMFKIKTVIAHYDRFGSSPGANDNSSSVMSILDWAVKLYKKGFEHNVRIIFTDGEELGQQSVKEQGAFALARLFNKLDIKNDDIFVFDCMGRGNIPILCQNHIPQQCSRSYTSKLQKLESTASEILHKANNGKWFRLPCNYSDNASFLANGIPAVAITMLPQEEVQDYLSTGKKPLTWQMLHTPMDNFMNLTQESFIITEKILYEVALYKTVS